MLAGALATALFGCANALTRKPVEYGVLATPGMEIAAEDGSFRIVSGERFEPPFQGDIWLQNSHPYVDRDTLIGAWRQALQHGARKVVVRARGREPLHGVLLLNTHVRGATGPSAFNYRIEVPDRYLDAATGGKTAVVYEMTDWINQQGGKNFWKSWILWISDEPFVDAAATAEAR